MNRLTFIKPTIRRLLLVAGLACTTLLAVYGAEPVRIVMFAFSPKPQILAQWQPLATALPNFETAAPAFTLRDICAYYRWKMIAVLLACGLIMLLGFHLLFTKRKLELAHRLLLREQNLLQESEHKLSDLLDNTDAYIYLKDSQGCYLYANRPVRELFDASMDEIVGQNDDKFFNAKTLLQLSINDRRALEQGKALNTEEININIKNIKDGGTSTYLSVKLPLRNEAGEIYALSGISTNISEHKQVEQEMKKSISLLYATLESANDAILVVDLNNTMVLHNQKFVDLWCITDEILAAKDDSATLSYVLYQLKDADDFLNKVHEIYATPEASSFDVLTFKNGKIIERYSIPQRIDGKVVGRVWSFRDITTRKQMEDALLESEFRWKFAIEGSGDGVWDWNIKTNEAQYSKRWKEMLGYSDDDILPTNQEWVDRIYPDDQLHVAETMHAYLEAKTAIYVVEYRLRCKDDSYKWILGRGMLVSHCEDGKPSRMIGTHTDITERKQTEEKLQLAASVFSHAREGIMITAADGTIIDVNDAFSHITGYARDEVLGHNPRLLSSGQQGTEFYNNMWSNLIKKGHWYGEVWNQRKNGEIYAEMLTTSAVRDTQGNTQHYVALFSDITSIKDYEKQLEQIAHYDALTSLPNRVLLADRLHQAMSHVQRREQQLAVVFLDLDGFKAINDNHGHDVGDQLLMIVATRMKQTLRIGDTLARLGGDEFVAVLLDLADVDASTPMLSRLLEAASQTVYIGDLVLQVSASLGITFYPQAEDIDADQLLRQADQAMYQAKQTGKNRYHLFNAEQCRSVAAITKAWNTSAAPSPLGNLCCITSPR